MKLEALNQFLTSDTVVFTVESKNFKQSSEIVNLWIVLSEKENLSTRRKFYDLCQNAFSPSVISRVRSQFVPRSITGSLWYKPS
jgi:hypothetical protein